MSKEKVAATSATTAAVVADAEELPRTIVRRVVKDKLSEVSSDGGDVTLHKEALLAFSESARIFIHYLSATAHDVCNESKRQMINADDVLNALEEIEFAEFVEPLRSSLDEFRKKAAGKRAGSAKGKEANKKRKTDEEATIENGKDDLTATENGKDDETVKENGKDEEAITENGKDEDDEINEDEDAEQASEDDKDDSHDS